MSNTKEAKQLTTEETYQKAVQAFSYFLSNEELLQFRDTFKELGDYKSSAMYLQRCEKCLAYTVGNTVTFGRYHGKDIVWRVLQKEGPRCLLFAAEVVDHRCFHHERDDSTWSNCDLRRWLNKEFLEEAFTLKERMNIMLSTHRNNIDPRWHDENGPDTRDKAFVFNRIELDEYVPNTEDRSIGEWWWLRGHGCSNLNQQAVYEDGTVYENGVSTHASEVGVRPAMWVHIK